MSFAISASVSTRSSSQELLEELRSQLTGRLITPDSIDFDDTRKVVYITVDRRPLAFVQAANAEDVAAAVKFAREYDIPLAVRSGGHSIGYYSVIDDGIVVDFSALKRVDIDADTRIARVQAGATSADLAAATGPHGLALSTGDTHSVCIGGLATGGGIGFMVRKYGLAIDNLLSAQVVTADGEIVTASSFEHEDFFWAIRGGGGNFGIITEFTFRLAQVGQVLGGKLMLPATREVIRGYLDYTVNAPEGLTTIANLMHAPPFPFVPQERVGEMVFDVLVTWTGDFAEGEKVIAPLRALATPVADTISPIAYPEMYKFTAQQAAPHGLSLRSMFADELSDDTIDATLDAMEQATSPFSIIQYRGLGGAMARIDEGATAFAHRDRRYLFAANAIWLDPADNDNEHRAWTESLWRAVRPDASGVYVNFLEAEGDARVRDAYPEATYTRLAEIKRKYDPNNLFRFNQNITPKS